MVIRLATPTDKKKVLQLFSQLGKIINERVCFDPKNAQAEIYGAPNYDNVMQRDEIKIFVVEDQREIVGTASFFIFTDMINGDKFAHIDDFVIDAPKRKKGYGTALMKGILEYAKEHQIVTVKLTSSLSFTEAHRFYEKLGGIFSQKVIKFDVIT